MKTYRNILLLLVLITYIQILSPTHDNIHKININLINTFDEKYSYIFYNQLANGDTHLRYDDDEQELAIKSLEEITNYRSVRTDCDKNHKNCIKIIWIDHLISIDNRNYKKVIYEALNEMNLECTNKEMIEQINKWICDNIEYEVTNGDLYKLFDEYQYKGQCWHYAKLFQDMCNAVETDMQYCLANDKSHAWNSCAINGITYYFDVTWNDSSGVYNKHLFITEEEFKQTHKL